MRLLGGPQSSMTAFWKNIDLLGGTSIRAICKPSREAREEARPALLDLGFQPPNAEKLTPVVKSPSLQYVVGSCGKLT